MQTIHDCLQASLQNEYFKEKLTEFYKENKRLKEELTELKRLRTLSVTKDQNEMSTQTQSECDSNQRLRGSTTCSVCIDRGTVNKSGKTLKSTSSTSMQEKYRPNTITATSTEQSNDFDNDMFNKKNKKSYVKLCEMQHNLLKKYEDEVNSNAVKQDLINHMKLELDQLNEVVKKSELEKSELMKRIGQLDELETSFKSMLLDYENCRIKCRKYKAELKCFDEKFFDELEDLKYNFYESIKLNKHYENLLFKLNKNELMVDTGSQKPKNRVKFAADEFEFDGGSQKKRNKTRRLSDLKQSFESMNKSFKDSLVCDSFPNESDLLQSGDYREEGEAEESGEEFNYEDYLQDDDFDYNQTLEYQDLLKRLTN